MRIQYTIRVEAEILENAKNVAETEMRSLNNLIEYAVKKYVDDAVGLGKINENKQNSKF